MAKIETGVDKLVDIINTHKRISVEDAAKKLGVSSVVVQEWADFLEEEELISIEYKFNKTLLVERKLTKKEIKDKAEEFATEKDAFLRKVETSLKTLDKETLGLKKIKDEFNKLKKEIGKEIDTVKNEVAELEKYSDLKKNLDKEIAEQQEEYKNLLDRSHKQIKAEQQKYQELLEKIEIEKRETQIKEKHLKSLEEKETHLKEKLKELYDLTNSIHEKIEEEEKDIDVTEKDINALEKTAERIEKEVQEKKSAINPLLNKVKEHEKEILRIQEKILNKVRQKTAEIRSQVKEGEGATEKFEAFFSKKKQIENMIDNIEKNKEDLRNELIRLTKKATTFDVATKSTNIRSHIADLEKELKNVESKKDKFKKQLNSLLKLIKG